jgi:hypothetical protein
MFIFHRDARGNKTVGEIRRELFVARGVPAELGQAHRRRVIEMLGMAES